ncbi:unnamed protein product [Prorocentrum cordatum]|uniref:Multicopper oxidase n=1 Tax=Prorocentrum cordatum TaxID=2364126 RepID=A0ABN9TWF3_9DINO|nr:unnamed protein product [Polarella glacialis]
MLRQSFVAAVALAPGVAATSGRRRYHELAYPSEVHAADGEYTLEMGEGLLLPNLPTRVYVNGPTFRVQPGESLRIKLQNSLSAEHNVGCDVTGTEYCEAATTNLHTHGLHTSPAGPDERGVSSDDVSLAVEPGASRQYEFTIPDYHMGGTHWYHPHHHHATALQAGGGAAGALIVDDPPGYLPEVYASMVEKVLVISNHNLAALENIAQMAHSGLLENASAIAAAEGYAENVFLVNGQLAPTMSINSHVWYRLRTVFAAVQQGLRLHVDPRESGLANCSWYLIAKDGVYLNEIPRKIDRADLVPGARADIAMSCTCATYPCRAVLRSQPFPTDQISRRMSDPQTTTDGPATTVEPGADGQTNDAPTDDATADVAEVTVLKIVITETAGGTVQELPVFSPDRPCYLADLRQASVPNGQSGAHMVLSGPLRAVTWDGEGTSMTYQNMKAGNNGTGYTMKEWPPITEFTVGSVYEWSVSFNGHPLHLHVNPYQIQDMSGESSRDSGYYQAGDWHDTLMLDVDATVRMNVDRFTGSMVVHCHILSHEDEGMMSLIGLTGTEGAAYSHDGATGCYSTAWSPGQAQIVSGAPGPAWGGLGALALAAAAAL